MPCSGKKKYTETCQKGAERELNLTRKQVQTAIKELQEEDLLEREGSNRNGRWVVKK